MIHARIIASPDGEAGRALATRLAAAELCAEGGSEPCGRCRSCRLAFSGIHPDISVISRPLDDKGRQRREIYVEQIRRMASEAWILPQESEKKVYIILEAHKMNTQAQNAALKILEEPPDWVSFILCAESAEALLPTVRSRCALIRAGEAPRRQVSEDAERFLKLAAAEDRLGLCAFWTALEKETDSQGLTELLESASRLISEALLDGSPKSGLSPRRLHGLLELCGRGQEYLRSNVSVKHVLGLMNSLSLSTETRGNSFD